MDTDDDSDEDMNDILLKLGMKGEIESQPVVEPQEKPILTKLLLALAMSKRSHELAKRSVELIEEILMKNPSLKGLSRLLSLAENYSPESIEEAKIKTKYPQSFSASRNKEYSPKTIAKGEHGCRQCSFVAKTWSGADSHIRQEHSHIFYGPCPSCDFKSPNQDVFRRHLLGCKNEVK